MKKISLALAAVLAAAAFAPAAAAQGTGSIAATATVLGQLTVTGNRGLVFGNVLPNVSKSLDVRGGTSGKFTVGGVAGSTVSMTFTVPSSLSSVSTTETLAIGSYAGVHNTTDANATGGATFTPSSTATSAVLSTTGSLFVFLGATVTPTLNQAAADYAGTVTLNATYTSF